MATNRSGRRNEFLDKPTVGNADEAAVAVVDFRRIDGLEHSMSTRYSGFDQRF
jgi:hypothetical protein